MKTTIPALAFAAAAAHAQFMDMLKSAVNKATEQPKAKEQEEAADEGQANEPASPFAALTAALKPAAVPKAAAKPGCLKTRATPPPLGERPDDCQPEILWPEDTGCDYYKFADLKFDAAREAKKAFVAEREGLYCEVKGEYAASAKWTEVL